MEELNSLINRPMANSNDNKNDCTKTAVKQPFKVVRSTNGQFKRRGDDHGEGTEEIKEKGILNPKISKLPKEQKDIKRPRKQDYENYKLVGLGFPTDMVQRAKVKGKEYNGHLRWSIPVYFQPKSDPSKTYEKNVQFGNVEGGDYVDTGDNMARLKYVNRKKTLNFLDGKFYKIHLLNSVYNDVYDATRELKRLLNV